MMRTNSLRRWVVAVLLLPAFGAGVLDLVFAQQAETRTAAPQRADARRLPTPAREGEPQICPSDAATSDHAYSGWQNCDFCHGRTSDLAIDENLRQDVLVASLKESNVWRHDDKHALAARVLYPDATERNLAYHMQQALGDARYEALVESDCQACHAAGQPLDPDYTAKPDNQIRLRHDHGVTCEACHGPAKDWIHPHWEERTHWRYKTPSEKQEDGLVNLRNPVIKARKCLSCHLGSVAEKKVVTHEMYAAGHPPLAGFDVATFSLAMPRHWVPLSERSGEEFAKYKDLHGASHSEAAQTREVLLGGLAALQSNLTLLADYAASPADQAGWPEFALYDCFACHHDLQPQSLRVRSRGGRRPGRPPLRTWPNVVAELAFAQTASSADLTAALSGVSAALDAQPFAERDRLGDAANGASILVCQEIERLTNQLDRSSLQNDQAAKERERQLVAAVLTQICDMAVAQLCDYDTARQLVWAFERVYDDHRKLNPGSGQHTAIQQALGELKDPKLRFDLVRGQQRVGEPTTLAAFLAARSEYDAELFATRFRRLRELVRNAAPAPQK